MKINVIYKRLYTIAITICMLSSVITIINVTAVSPPIVDGIISPGEYDAGVHIVLEGPWDSPSSPYDGPLDGYLYWDAQYLWIAVNEPVPEWGGGSSFIEFMWDAGIHGTLPYYNAWVLFSNGNWQYVHCGKPTGCWGWTAARCRTRPTCRRRHRPHPRAFPPGLHDRERPWRSARDRTCRSAAG